MRYLKIITISSGFVFILVLYYYNTNATLLGIIFDSFWINFLTVLFFLLLHHSSNISLPDKFYEIQEFEKSGQLYRIMGAKFFKWLLTKNPIPTFTARIVLNDHSAAGLFKLEKEMKNAETVHFLGFISVLIIMIPFGCYKDPRYFYFMNVFNTIENFYPVLVQRYNRNRIHHLVGNGFKNQVLQ